MRVGRGSRRHRFHALKRVAFENDGGKVESGHGDRLLFEEVVYGSRVGDVVVQQADGILHAVETVGAGEIFVAEAGGAGELGVGDHGVVVEDGAEVKVGLRVFGRLLLGANVVDGEDNDGLRGTDGRVPSVEVIVHQLFRLVAIIHHRVDESNHFLELVLGEHKLGEVPVLGGGIEYFHGETSDDAEVVASATKTPPEVGIGLFRDGDGLAACQDDVDVDEIVRDETIEALISS